MSSRQHEPAPGAASCPSTTTDPGPLFVTELLRREGLAEEPPPAARPTGTYQLLAVVAGLILLCAAAAASAAALSGPRTERAAPNRPGAHAIAGAEALRPDLINASIEFPPLATPPPSTGAPDPASTVDQDPAGGVRDRGTDPILRTAATFYETVVANPRQAFGLLDQQMRGSGYKEFQQAWAGVERVGVDRIRRDGPDGALVTASLERRDGSVLHTVSRLVIIPDAQPQITDARLLAAARS